MARKSKSSADTSIRDELTTQFIEELARDFAEHGKEIVETVRKESPSKYSELILRLIPLEPRLVQSENQVPKDSREIAEHLLKDVGLDAPTDHDRERALQAYDTLITTLTQIAQEALGVH
jgi:hypothetical protein